MSFTRKDTYTATTQQTKDDHDGGGLLHLTLQTEIKACLVNIYEHAYHNMMIIIIT
jgi:hypothetical protein